MDGVGKPSLRSERGYLDIIERLVVRDTESIVAIGIFCQLVHSAPMIVEPVDFDTILLCLMHLSRVEFVVCLTNFPAQIGPLQGNVPEDCVVLRIAELFAIIKFVGLYFGGFEL
jgi:hypothetical protein